MISLNLQFFGGRGGGGGGGGGKGGKGKDNSKQATPVSNSAPGGRGSAGGSRGYSQYPKVESVNGNDNYIMLESKSGKEIEPRNATGKTLVEFIKKGKIRFDKSRGIWVSSSGKKYIIRKR